MKSEATILKLVMLKISNYLGTRIFRNNCGVAKFKNGNVVKYGVANPGGSDLIGYTPVIITQEMVGRKVAVFLAIETKNEAEFFYIQRNFEALKTYEGEDDKKLRYKAQIKFIESIKAAGGIAAFVKNDKDALDIIDKFCDYRNS